MLVGVCLPVLLLPSLLLYMLPLMRFPVVVLLELLYTCCSCSPGVTNTG